jgi:hypothetical protein
VLQTKVLLEEIVLIPILLLVLAEAERRELAETE